MLAACAPQPLEGFETTQVEVGEESLDVALAVTGPQRAQGLQGRDDFPRGLEGVLFVYDEPRTATFHMRTVGFPLDIWWFDEDGHLIGMTEMETCLDRACDTYTAPGEVMWALETAAGEFSFNTEDSLSFPDAG